MSCIDGAAPCVIDFIMCEKAINLFVWFSIDINNRWMQYVVMHSPACAHPGPYVRPSRVIAIMTVRVHKHLCVKFVATPFK